MPEYSAELARLEAESQVALNKLKTQERADGIVWWSALVVWISVMAVLIAVVAAK